MITYKSILDHRQWKSTTGLSEKEFHILSKLFGKTYEKQSGIDIVKKSFNLQQDFLFSTYEDCLFFLLFYLKNPVVFDTLGFIFDTNTSVVQKNFKRLLPILEETLNDKGLLPKRQFTDIDDFKRCLGETDEIIFDATELPIQRPKDKEKQKELYSGKKKLHTIKNLLVTDTKKYILYLSHSFLGKNHDFSILQKEFPCTTQWFENLKVRLDLGFQGFDKLYETIKTYIPSKRKKAVKGLKIKLTSEQKQQNKILGKERIPVEHSIGGMKRYRLIHDKLRFKSHSLIDRITGVCAGLWNFSLSSNC